MTALLHSTLLSLLGCVELSGEEKGVEGEGEDLKALSCGIARRLMDQIMEALARHCL